MVGKWLFHDDFDEIEEEVKEILNQTEYKVGGYYTSPILPDYVYVKIIYMDGTYVVYKMWHRDRYLLPTRSVTLEKFNNLFPNKKIIDNHDNR